MFILTDIDSVQAKLPEQEHIALQTWEIVVCNRIHANSDLVRNSSDEELRGVRIRHVELVHQNLLVYYLSGGAALGSGSALKLVDRPFPKEIRIRVEFGGRWKWYGVTISWPPLA